MTLSRYLPALTAAALLGVAAPASAEAPHKITMALPSKSMVTAGPRIAKEMGLFDKYGLDVTFTYVDNTNGTATAVISRSVEFGQSGTTEPILAQSRGQALVIVANNYNGLSGNLVLAKAVDDKLGVKPDAPIADRLKALDGLTIASTSPTSTFTTGYGGSAKAVGATPKFTYMAISAMPAAMESGAVQGFVATAPFWAQPVTKGTGVLWIAAGKAEMPAEYLPASAAVVVAMRDYCDANPAIANGVVSAFADLTKAFQDRPADVKAAMSRLFPDIDPASMDLLFSMESRPMTARVLGIDDIRHDIGLIKATGVQSGDIDKVDPAAVLLKR